jgi:hypothetical protein
MNQLFGKSLRKLLHYHSGLGHSSPKKRLIVLSVRGSGALTDRLRAVRNSVEMSVKIIWPNLSEREQGNSDPGFDQSAMGPGAAYLISRREEFLGRQELAEEAKAIADWVGSRLNGFSRQHQGLSRTGAKNRPVRLLFN